ncbi:ABC transporter permease subunit [Chelativorans sp. ZYF759]|jgi:polar amino acid transport system permease protein|uniref:ABC transporter permease n=1 Tax=Chelativorans sp. ZYF759 TaxID=2692213 RepID=UPI00145FA14E|nr:ABC transporter permease subunit [Chelativorans sp. ZYF759]NMG40137.1 ABC transporter permease subunit [Chelativorans sp. ZYF759]
MFAFCADPSALPQWQWFACYLTSGTHLAFYWSFVVVIVLILLAAPASLLLGFGGALAQRSRYAPLRWFGAGYTSMVRGVPDIVFFLFVPIAVDQSLEFLMHQIRCPDWDLPIRRGNDFLVCPAAKVPLSTSPSWVHDFYAFGLALLAFALVFGAFAANTLRGAMEAVPKAQIETAEAYGMTRGQAFRRVLLPQMWVYALPGLSNLWMILIKATPLLFLLGIQDIVFWARELGGAKTSLYTYPHPDWRVWYFLVVLIFYLLLTWVSQFGFERLMGRLSVGQATAGGERMRKAGL